jgi:hypothetical protein
MTMSLILSLGNRRDYRNPGRNEAADHHKRYGRVATVGMNHNGGIITQENFLCPNFIQSDRIQAARRLPSTSHAPVSTSGVFDCSYVDVKKFIVRLKGYYA